VNAVEIEEAVSSLASADFDAKEFPYSFLAAFGNKATTIKRLRSGSSNSSDVPGGVLQRSNIHMAVCAPGTVNTTLVALRQSPKTATAKAKFVLATDGIDLEAEELTSGETIACTYGDFARHFGFFLPLAGISTVRQITNNPIDIKATGRLNKLYVELLKDNEDWGTDARRQEVNQFMARLIFCFFAEDTGIFLPGLFTETIRQMSDSQSGNTHEVITELFRAMVPPRVWSTPQGGRGVRYALLRRPRAIRRPRNADNGRSLSDFGARQAPRWSVRYTRDQPRATQRNAATHAASHLPAGCGMW
jgi:hypothetical protein